jgi:hypothetical protein
MATVTGFTIVAGENITIAADAFGNNVALPIYWLDVDGRTKRARLNRLSTPTDARVPPSESRRKSRTSR